MNPYPSHRNQAHRHRLDSAGRRTRTGAESGILRGWLRSATRSWQRRRMIAQLDALDDNILRDIGIPRGDIARVVDGLTDRELGMAPLDRSGERDNADSDAQPAMA